MIVLCVAVSQAVGQQLHVIVDEIYANSVYNPLPPPQFLSAPITPVSHPLAGSSFTSALHYLDDTQHTPNTQYIHVVQGLSKDFGLSGYRVGWVVTRNEALLEAWGNVGYFASVSNDVQSALTQILQDEVWVDEFLYENCQLLREAYKTVTALLDGSHPSISVRGDDGEVMDDGAFAIPYIPAVAGMFVWVDLRGFLPPQETPGVNVWAHEERLFDLLMDEAKVVMTPGHAQGANEPGWFRLCFAWVTNEALVVGVRRLRRTLYKQRGGPPSTTAP